MKVVNNTQLPTMEEPIEAQINTNGLVCALSFFFSPGENRILQFSLHSALMKLSLTVIMYGIILDGYIMALINSVDDCICLWFKCSKLLLYDWYTWLCCWYEIWLDITILDLYLSSLSLKFYQLNLCRILMTLDVLCYQTKIYPYVCSIIDCHEHIKFKGISWNFNQSTWNAIFFT